SAYEVPRSSRCALDEPRERALRRDERGLVGERLREPIEPTAREHAVRKKRERLPVPVQRSPLQRHVGRCPSLEQHRLLALVKRPPYRILRELLLRAYRREQEQGHVLRRSFSRQTARDADDRVVRAAVLRTLRDDATEHLEQRDVGDMRLQRDEVL